MGGTLPQEGALSYVLVVADELAVRSWTSHVLQESGIPASFAAGRQEALRLTREIGPPDVLVTKVDLGEWQDGFNLADTLREAAPDLETIFLTGNRPYVPRGSRQQGCVLPATCDPAVFLAAVRKATVLRTR